MCKMEKTLWNSRKSPWEGILASFFRLSNVFQALYILKGRGKHTTVMLFPFSCLVPHPIVHTYPISSKHHIKFRLCSHTCWRNIYLHLKGSLKPVFKDLITTIFFQASVTRLSSPPPVTPIVAPMLIPVMNSLVSQNEVELWKVIKVVVILIPGCVGATGAAGPKQVSAARADGRHTALPSGDESKHL